MASLWMGGAAELPSIESLSEVLKYIPETGEFFWAKDINWGKNPPKGGGKFPLNYLENSRG